ncbi:hypothetical protein SAMD00019534_002900 [Acytostelium subglobosum LB1]|uniref:hypothetical protein n=1 Tax=Acytostelium subglobosum LB1 TaxID=1410327 RepID=UPI0006448EF2|nr:hypothetical protein SAMD00019534_002900 [Acytostelium subglobosum LB1]GAM17115.1 hypothetical protein SAMD00019534_002900 [Acytostelium subglobosum LB1]|eukprot:XP_012759177.1 hypothetical protein SAMD00019534_002900 [Acytostelium subglobosum LB1]
MVSLFNRDKDSGIILGSLEKGVTDGQLDSDEHTSSHNKNSGSGSQSKERGANYNDSDSDHHSSSSSSHTDTGPSVQNNTDSQHKEDSSHHKEDSSHSKDKDKDSSSSQDPTQSQSQSMSEGESNKSFLFLFGNTEWFEPSGRAGNYSCGTNRDAFVASNDMSRLNEADGIIFFASDMAEGDESWKIKLPDWYKGVTVLYYLESPPSYLAWCVRTPSCIEYFNWTIGYMPVPLNDIRESYLHKQGYDIFLEEQQKNPFNFTTDVMAFKENGKVASWMSSSCNSVVDNIEESDRNRFMRRVMEKMHVDSYGSCLHNKDLPAGADRSGLDPFSTKSKIINPYKFYFALENSNCPYYITEKVQQCLFHGIVPVYMGHETTLQYLPPGSYIDVKQFNTTQQLVDHLIYLDQNVEEYHKYFAWREDIEVVKRWGSEEFLGRSKAYHLSRGI